MSGVDKSLKCPRNGNELSESESQMTQLVFRRKNLTHQILNFQKEKFDSPNFELAVHVARIVDKGRSHYVHLPHHL